MSTHIPFRTGLFAAALTLAGAASGATLDEWKVKRKPVFAFTRTPSATRDGDRIAIAFAVKDFCDVTVAVEDAEGRIVRHLACGVLGANAPRPFRKDSLEQTVVWDGKDDTGRYVDDKDALTVRVSLGLRPRCERSLLWSPKKRIGNYAPTLCATPEGVYVVEGLGVDHIRLFDHDGNYVRTVYPFPRGKLEEVAGLEWRTYPQDGRRLPVKHGFVQGSLLSSGTSYIDDAEKHRGGEAATTMAVWSPGDGRLGRIALAYYRVNRLATDGSSPRAAGKRLPLAGPEVGIEKRLHRTGSWGGLRTIGPSSAAFSPDGRFLYLTGHTYAQTYPRNAGCWHGVYRLDYASDAKPEVFLGEMTEKGYGTDHEHFMVPTSVDTDAKGRVYVSDFMNDRVQVFSPAGKYLKTLATEKPAKVLVHRRTGEVFVFSWPAKGVSNEVHRKAGEKINWRKFQNKLTRYASFERGMKRLDGYPLPSGRVDRGGMVSFGTLMHVAIDSWTERPRLWVVGHKHAVTAAEVSYWGQGTSVREQEDRWAGTGVRIFELRGEKWELVRDFAADVRRKIVRVKPPAFSRQRLYFNRSDGKLYVAEDSGFGKSFNAILQVDPGTGKVRTVPLPFDAEDLCFDVHGRAYLRTDTLVVRYDSGTWREVPWDYGEEHPNVYFSSIGGGKHTAVVSGLPTPGRRPVCWHQGGMGINALGQLAVSCCSRAKPREREVGVKARVTLEGGKAYTPTLYPGRTRWQEIHVWDKHGKLIHEDAVWGLGILGGTEIDRAGDLYVLADSTRAIGGKQYLNEMTGTVMKFRPGKGKVLSAGRAVIPLPASGRPDRPPDVRGGRTGSAWVEGVDWMYGAAGWFGFNTARAGGGCDCWHSRFCLDLFARSFVPEVERYRVAVLDAAGNLILRVGQYGNVDDGVPLAPDPEATVRDRSIGGGEVALFHAAYVGTHTDRRLFIHDAGNGRIVGVRLDYHATERAPLADAPEANGGERP
jgi:hypothetical protein